MPMNYKKVMIYAKLIMLKLVINLNYNHNI